MTLKTNSKNARVCPLTSLDCAVCDEDCIQAQWKRERAQPKPEPAPEPEAA